MNILFVVPSMGFGGAEKVITILANHWVAKGNAVSIYITGSKEECSYSLDEGVRLDYFLRENKYSPLSLIRAIRKKALETKPDCVICFANDVCAYTCISLLGIAIPVYYSERNDPKRNYRTWKEKLFRQVVIRLAKGYVFQTEEARRWYGNRVQEKSCIILNPIEVGQLPYHNPACERKEIVSVGRLEAQKNQELLIKAFASIEKDFPEYVLTIYGEGHLRGKLEDLIQRLQLSGRVFLPGTEKEVHNKIKDASLFVLSSDYEGLPNALIEALAIGIPCISTDCSPGGARMLINDGVNGIIVPCGNQAKLAEAMKECLRSGEKRYSLGLHAHEIRKSVEIDKISNEWLSFLCSK